MTDKLCTECKHYLWCNTTFDHKCNRLGKIKYSLVNGAKTLTKLKNCQDERYDTGTDLDICGLKGKYYEPLDYSVINND